METVKYVDGSKITVNESLYLLEALREMIGSVRLLCDGNMSELDATQHADEIEKVMDEIEERACVRVCNA